MDFKTCVILLCVLATIVFEATAITKWKPNMKTFSHAIKGGRCPPGKEIQIFSHQSGPGVLTEQWFSGTPCFGPSTIIRYYIDGAKKPSIEMNLFMAHGFGIVTNNNTQNMNDFEEDFENTDDPDTPWGTKRIGHLARGGGIYNTIRFPFAESIRVTFTTETSGYFWIIVRGVENYPVVIGDLELPKNARLNLYKLENVTLQPLEFVTLASAKGTAGLLYQVTLAATSIDFHYLEACFRAAIDYMPGVQLLSSGTEDLFLSAYYFDKGRFHTDHAGMTYKKNPGTMTAYKFFEDDPVLFNEQFKLIWRCGEACADQWCGKVIDGACFIENNEVYCRSGQDSVRQIKYLKPKKTTITSYVWMYTWPKE